MCTALPAVWLAFALPAAAQSDAAALQTRLALAPAATMPRQDARPAAELALGIEIAGLLNPKAATLDVSRRMVDQIILALKNDPEHQKLENAYPGITAHVLNALKPEVEAFTLARMPVLIERIGQLFAGSMTSAELRATRDFYASPTGAWLIDAIVRNPDDGGIFAASLKNPNAQVTANQVAAANQMAIADVKVLNPQQRRDITVFELSPAGQRVKAIMPRVHQITAEWANERDPEVEQRMEEIAVKAGEDFIARAEARR